MGISPIYAIPKVLAQVGLAKDDVDIYEVGYTGNCLMSFSRQSFQINEAFASQFAYCVEQLGVPIKKINPKYITQIVYK